MATVPSTLDDAMGVLATVVADGTLSAEEFAQHPREPWCELVAGKLQERAMGAEASEIQLWLGYFLLMYLKAHPLGRLYDAECGYQLSPNYPASVRKPDLSFVRFDRLPSGTSPKGWMPFAPDLAIEVVSPHDNAEQLQAKVEQYLASGVRIVWVVWPQTQLVTVHRPNQPIDRLTTADTLRGEDVLPGFALPVQEIFNLPQPPAAPEAPSQP